jgi:hypothetical protein
MSMHWLGALYLAERNQLFGESFAKATGQK